MNDLVDTSPAARAGVFAGVLLRRRKVAAAAAGAVCLLGALGFGFAPRWSIVKTTLLEMTFDRMGSLPPAGSRSEPMGLAVALGAKPTDPVRALLLSRTLKVRVAGKIAPGGDPALDSLKALGYKLRLAEGPGGTIEVTLEGKRHSPEETARVAQVALDELSAMLSQETLTDTKRQRLYTEKLLEENASRRHDLEETLMGVVGPDASVSLDPEMVALLERVSELRARAAAERTTAQAIDRVAVDPPGVPMPGKSLVEQAGELEADAAGLVAEAKTQAKEKAGGGMVVPLARVPVLALQYRRMQGELKVLDEVHALLAREREMALIQEAREAPGFTVIDAPVAAAAQAWPGWKRWTWMTLASALFSAVGVAFFGEWWAREKGAFRRAMERG